jgi:hypothetical protein
MSDGHRRTRWAPRYHRHLSRVCRMWSRGRGLQDVRPGERFVRAAQARAEATGATVRRPRFIALREELDPLVHGLPAGGGVSRRGRWAGRELPYADSPTQQSQVRIVQCCSDCS